MKRRDFLGKLITASAAGAAVFATRGAVAKSDDTFHLSEIRPKGEKIPNQWTLGHHHVHEEYYIHDVYNMRQRYHPPLIRGLNEQWCREVTFPDAEAQAAWLTSIFNQYDEWNIEDRIYSKEKVTVRIQHARHNVVVDMGSCLLVYGEDTRFTPWHSGLGLSARFNTPLGNEICHQWTPVVTPHIGWIGADPQTTWLRSRFGYKSWRVKIINSPIPSAVGRVLEGVPKTRNWVMSDGKVERSVVDMYVMKFAYSPNNAKFMLHSDGESFTVTGEHRYEKGPYKHEWTPCRV